MKIQIADILKYIWQHPANRGKRVFAVLQAISWQIGKRLMRKPRDIAVFGGMVLRCYPDSPSASLVIYCNESPDYHEMHFMRRYLRAGDAVLDVGANIGVYSLLAASCVGASGQVLAFEPGPEARRRLLENIELNALRNVHVHACALGDREGTVEFLDRCDTTNRIRTEEDAGKSTVTVPVVRLDDLVDISCALGKMDIEGAEPLALCGAERLLAGANPPVWLIELNGSLHAFGHTEEGFVLWLANRGYDVALYDADRNVLDFQREKPWLESPNVLAVARAQRQAVAKRSGALLVEM
jgi:FkbM family methyltransferase